MFWLGLLAVDELVRACPQFVGMLKGVRPYYKAVWHAKMRKVNSFIRFSALSVHECMMFKVSDFLEHDTVSITIHRLDNNYYRCASPLICMTCGNFCSRGCFSNTPNLDCRCVYDGVSGVVRGGRFLIQCKGRDHCDSMIGIDPVERPIDYTVRLNKPIYLIK